MIDIMEIVSLIKQEICNYTGNENLSEIITNNINIVFLAADDFLKLSGTKSLSEAPGAFHKRDNNTVYMLKKDTYNNNDIHKIIHELLHAYSNSYANSGKEGLTVYGYDENNHLISAGGALNEAATEYLTSIINKDGFAGYPDDMKYIFELFIDILNIRFDFVTMYFQKDNWITEELNKKFNSSKTDQLDEFVLEFDNRLPMYRKQLFDFNRIVSILLDSINDKLTNFIDINYESITKNLFMIKRCDFELTQDILDKIKYLEMIIESSYGIRYDKQTDEQTIDNSQNIEDGKIKLGF